MDSQKEPPPPHSAKFDLETPPSSATAQEAAGKAAFSAAAQDAADNLATVSLSSPQASDAADAALNAAFSPDAEAAAQPPSLSGATLAAAGLSTSGRSTDADSARPGSSSAGGLPLSATPASASSRAESTSQGGAWACAAAAPAPPELPKAYPVKVWVKDPEKQAERSRLGVALGSFVTCLVRTECSTACPLAAGATPAGSTAAASSGAQAAAAVAGAAGAADSQPAQQQQQQTPDGTQVFEVRRRFDDFDALSRLLKAHFRGFFIPRLPSSEWLTAGDTYLRTRRVNLQDYLGIVANHPGLQGSDELQLFLTEPGDLAACSRWQRMLQRPAPMDALFGLRRADAAGSGNDSPTAAGTAAAAAGAGGGGVSGAAGAGWGVMQRMRTSLMSVVQLKAPTELSAEEQQLRQAKESFKELQQHLVTCVSAVRSLVGNMEALCEDYGELGRSLSHFARFEEALAARQGQYTVAGSSAVQRGAHLQRLGYGALRQQSLSKQLVLSAGASLVFLPDYAALIPECVATLQEREDALAGVQALAQQLKDRQDAAAKAAAALGPAAAGDKRMVAMNAAVQALQDKLLAAEQQYQLLKSRNKTELERLDLKRAEDFRRALGRFAASQAQTAAAAAHVWAGVAEQFSS